MASTMSRSSSSTFSAFVPRNQASGALVPAPLRKGRSPNWKYRFTLNPSPRELVFVMVVRCPCFLCGVELACVEAAQDRRRSSSRSTRSRGDPDPRYRESWPLLPASLETQHELQL